MKGDINMFDNLTIAKAYKLTDNITGNEVEIATFNAVLHKGSNINVYMNINYPNLYTQHKDAILASYREFNAEISSLACAMELSDMAIPCPLTEVEPLRKEFKEKALDVFNQVIDSLGDIRVNPVPVMNTPRY